MSAREDAIKGLAKVADDWGWKGGKQGEITGGELVRKLQAKEHSTGEMLDFYRRLAKSKQENIKTALNNLNTSYGPFGASELMAYDFDTLEKAGIPREWTGKVLNALGGQIPRSNVLGVEFDAGGRMLAKQVSDLMRPMTNDQRQTFLNLLPRWTGTLETAAKAAKKLYSR